jgi:GWxTD domain-containing protein
LIGAVDVPRTPQRGDEGVRAVTLFVLFLCSFSAPRLFAQTEPPGARESAFSLYAHAFMDSERKPTLAVDINVPYSSLIFLKRGAAFQSEYVAYLKILDKKNRLVDSAVLNETVVAEDYQTTRSTRQSSKASQRFYLAQGDYTVDCAIEVKNTIRVFRKTVAVTVPEFARAGLSFGPPRLYAVAPDTSASAPVFFELPPDESLDGQEIGGTLFVDLYRRPALRFELYAREETKDSTSCELYFEVVDGNKAVHAYGRRRVRMGGLRADFVVNPDVDDWDPGPYVLNVKAIETDPPGETTVNFAFTLGYTRAMLTKYFDRTIAILSLIATPREIEEFKNAPEAERAEVWAAFWARRDPSAGTGQNEALIEHLRRVRYAVDNLADGRVGWESDRGKVYIKYGEPDHTEVRIDSQYAGEYLIWYYYKENKTFVFYDRMGLGEYRLTDASQL